MTVISGSSSEHPLGRRHRIWAELFYGFALAGVATASCPVEPGILDELEIEARLASVANSVHRRRQLAR